MLSRYLNVHSSLKREKVDNDKKFDDQAIQQSLDSYPLNPFNVSDAS